MTSMNPEKSASLTLSTPLTRLAVWLLAMALLVSQTFGLVHGVVHAPARGLPYGVTQWVAVDAGVNARADSSLPPVKGWVASLFSSHNGSADCRLYDQASHGSAALRVVSLALPVVLSSFAIPIFEGDALARRAALFDARGPPLTS